MVTSPCSKSFATYASYVTSVRRWFAAANTSITAPVAAAVEPGARVRALGVVRDSSGTGIYNREKAMFLAVWRFTY